MIGYWIGIIGTWVFADGVASLWQYTRPERNEQSWFRDHSFRLVRMAMGLILIYLGFILYAGN